MIKKKKQSGRVHKPTDEQRVTVKEMSAGGIPQADIARVIGIDRGTLAKHYRKELDTAATIANSAIAQTLFEKAKGGDTTAMIWWTKARMRWSEKQEVELSGEVKTTNAAEEVKALFDEVTPGTESGDKLVH